MCFNKCENLKEVIILGNIKSINSIAFAFCTSLERVIINCNDKNLLLEEIGAQAFYGCELLNTILFNPDENLISDQEYKSLILPSSVKSIGNEAFYNCIKIEEIYVHAANYIGNDAFSTCTALKTLTIGGNPEFAGEDIIPKNVKKLTAPSKIVETLSSPGSLATSHNFTEIIINGGDSFEAELVVTTKFNTLEFNNVKNINLKLTIQSGFWEPGHKNESTDYPNSANISIKIGKSTEFVMFDFRANNNHTLTVNFEDFNNWNLIDYSSFMPRVSKISNSDVIKYAKNNNFKYYEFKKGDVTPIKALFEALNDEILGSLIALVCGMLMLMLMFIITLMSPSRRKNKAQRKGKEKKFGFIYYIVYFLMHIALILTLLIPIIYFIGPDKATAFLNKFK